MAGYVGLLTAAVLWFCLVYGITGVYVYDVEPRYISRAGAPITIVGYGFSSESYDPSNPAQYSGNRVFLVGYGLNLECSVVNHYTNEEKIVCIAPAVSSGVYSMYVHISVDGGAAYRSYDYVYYHSSYTPYLMGIDKRSTPPGTPLTFRAQMYKDRVVGTDYDTLFINPKVGEYSCDLRNPLNGSELYGIALFSEDSNSGTFTCRPRGITPGYYDVDFAVSNYGYSELRNYYYHISQMNNKQQLYIHQSYPVIRSVSSNEGSTAGGQTLAIGGIGFVSSASTTVEIGGTPCDITSLDVDEIQCTTRPHPSKSRFYPGDNGVIMEMWNETDYSDIDDIRKLNSSMPDYHRKYLNTFNYPERESEMDSFLSGPVLDEYVSNSFSIKARAYVAPMKSGWYSLMIRSQCYAELWMAVDGDTNNLTRVAFSDIATGAYIYSSKPEKISDKMWLEAGQRIYIEMYLRQLTGRIYFGVGLYIHDTDLTHDDWSWAQDEYGSFRFNSVVRPEIQFVNLTGAVDPFKLQFGDRVSGPIDPIDYTEEQVETAIEELFKAQCEQSGSPGDIFYEDMFEYSYATTDPFCGISSKMDNLYAS